MWFIYSRKRKKVRKTLNKKQIKLITRAIVLQLCDDDYHKLKFWELEKSVLRGLRKVEK